LNALRRALSHNLFAQLADGLLLPLSSPHHKNLAFCKRSGFTFIDS